MLVLIVPYRQREEHKKVFIPYMIEYFSKKKIEFHILIIEQFNNTVFNRGLLRNIGFLESQKLFNDFYVCFHDIDILPKDMLIDYNKPNNNTIRHQYGEIQCLGCMILCNPDTFIKLNGYPNDYWGWGFEDESLITRSIYNHVDIDRTNFVQRWTLQNYFTELNHDKPKNEDSKFINDNRLKTIIERIYPKTHINNGLNNCKYIVIKKNVSKNITHIFVDFN